MKWSDLLLKHIYYVDFDPVRECEFDGKHLAVVIKKNNDKKTLIVVPLTTSSNGEGRNKIRIGKISNLPSNLRKNDSYAVFNQVRTVNYKRFYPLKDDSGNNVQCKIEDTLFIQIVSKCLVELSSTMSLEEKINFYHANYIDSLVSEVINLAYKIKKSMPGEDVTFLKQKIKKLLKYDISLDSLISEADKERGIIDIINDCLKTELPLTS